jgi:hypothetical protein
LAGFPSLADGIHLGQSSEIGDYMLAVDWLHGVFEPPVFQGHFVAPERFHGFHRITVTGITVTVHFSPNNATRFERATVNRFLNAQDRPH